MAVKTTPPATPEFSGRTTERPSTDVKDDKSVDPQAQADPNDAAPPLEADEADYSDYQFVRFPNGELRAIRKTDIQNAGPGGGFETLTGPSGQRDESEVYVHLADGSVEKCKAYEVPPAAGTNYPNGFWYKDDKAYMVTAVYPAETAHQSS